MPKQKSQIVSESIKDRLNGAIKARFDLLRGGVGDAELRDNLLQ